MVVELRRVTKRSCSVTASSGRRTSGPSRATSMLRSSRIQCANCLSLWRDMSGPSGVTGSGGAVWRADGMMDMAVMQEALLGRERGFVVECVKRKAQVQVENGSR